uniref:Bardet-Biedl syndrome 7 protein homolog n=1 Tax=Parastrongyloides trichosuri TaxID=131310 RepID=A0A0N5A236_PARTI
MNLNLSRIDILQVGITSKNCLKIISQIDEDKKGKKKKKQKNLVKIVIGSQDGILNCIENKDSDINILFKTLPGPPITCVKLGGAISSVQDRIFVSIDNFVKGYTKKGKQFFSYECNFTEPISGMYVYGVDLLVSSKNVLAHYHDLVEINSYICGELITDVICLPISEGGWVGRGLTPIISCEDKKIRVLSNGELCYVIKISDVANILQLYMNDGGFSKRKVLYGTRDGKIGLLDLPEKDGSVLWEIDTTSNSKITSIFFYSLYGNNHPDVIVGKDDGIIEFFNVDERDNLTLKQSYNCEDSVTGVACGRFRNPNYDEIIVSSYSGWIFSLTTEPIKDSRDGLSKNVPQLDIRMEQLKKEVIELENQLQEHRIKFQESSTKDDDDTMIAPEFVINDNFTLNKELACYTLSIELVLPIDFVVLQSNVNVELMDVDKNLSVVSLTNTELFPEHGNALLATYRCQSNTNRIEIRIRSVEGQYGVLKAYIVPRGLPKTCQLRTYSIKPLALHEKIHDFDENRPLNKLILEGNFNLAEAHSWLYMCCSQVSDKCPPLDEAKFYFKSTFNGGTLLRATYSKGKAVYESDNLSTIAILKDVISKEITEKEFKVNLNVVIDDTSIPHTLKLMHPKMEYQTNLLFKIEMARALKELQSTYNDISYLSPDLVEILDSYDILHEENNKQAIYFDRLIGMISDLYIDKFKMRGQNSKHKIPELIKILHDNYSLENVIEFFNRKL